MIAIGGLIHAVAEYLTAAAYIGGWVIVQH